MARTVTIPGFVRWAFRAAAKQPGWVALTGLAVLLQVGAGLALPLAMELILDDAIGQANRDALYLAVGGLAAASLIFFLSGVAQDLSNTRISAQVITRLQVETFSRMQTASPRFFARFGESDILSRLSGDIRDLEMAMVRGMPSVTRGVLKLFVNGAVLFWIEWRLALLTFLLGPFALIGPRLVARRAQQAESARLEGNASVAKIIQESVAGHYVVKTFRLDRHLLGQLQGQLGFAETATVRANRLVSLVGRLGATGVTLVQFTVVCVGAWFVIEGPLTAGGLLAAIALLGNVSAAAQSLTDVVPVLMRGATGLARVQVLMDEETDSPRYGDRPLNTVQEMVSLKGVSFSYDGARANLDEVTLEIPAGMKVAVVGPSGSGKSTVLSMLLRLYEPDAGEILIDGQPLRETDEDSLRAQVTVVPQSTRLFDISIRENIRLGRLDATDEELEAAARRAEIHEAITAMPQGYDTIVGGGGDRISGGQRQRIAIARALLRDPSLLLLDEATSALDPGSEAALNRTLEEVSEGKTLVSVTHRLNAVVGYDRIFVMKDGRLVEEGAHDALLSQDGLYAELWRKQSGFEVSATGDQVVVTPERLRQIPFLATLDAPRLQEVADALEVERFAAEQTLFDQGAAGDKFYLLARGAVEVWQQDGEEQRLLRVMEDGDYFGEIAIVEQTPRTTTIKARTRCLCLSLQRDRFLRLLRDSPELEKEILQTIQDRRYRSWQATAAAG